MKKLSFKKRKASGKKNEASELTTKLVEAAVGIALIHALTPVLIENMNMPWYKRLYFDIKAWFRRMNI